MESVEGVSVTPGSLSFGRAPLAAPHVKVVTVTNTANSTLHLASVAGTTPDFHASFFESKVLKVPETGSALPASHLELFKDFDEYY